MYTAIATRPGLFKVSTCCIVKMCIRDRDYIALLPLDEDGNPNEAGEVYLYRYFEDEDGNPSLENILDDEEYEIVADRFDEIQDEQEFEEM